MTTKLEAALDRFVERPNIEPNFATGIVDDGTGPAPEVGTPRPMSMDPASGAVLVKDSATAISLGDKLDDAIALLAGIDDNTTTIAGTAASAVGTIGDSGNRVYVVAANTLTTQPAPQYAATFPHAGTETPTGQTFYLAGYDRIEQVVGESTVWTMPGTVWQGGAFSVDQGSQGPIDRPWPVQLSNAVEPIGTESAPLVARPPAYEVTSFGQIRVAQREVLFENVQTYGLDARAWSSRTVGGGSVAFDATSGVTNLSASAASGDVAEISTHTHFPYEPGATSHPLFTLKHSDSGAAGQKREWGFGTLDDFYGWRLLGTSLYIVRRSSSGGSAADENVVAQADWNGDPFDGSGTSGLSLDLTNINQWEIDLQWLSVGAIRFWIDGRLAHTLDLRGTIALPSTRTAQLPLRITIENVGESSSASMGYVCAVVYLDGGTPIRYVPGSHPLSAPKTGIGTSFTPVLGLRIAATYQGRDNRKIVIPRLARVANSSGRGTVRLVFDPASTTGGSWAAVANAPWVEYNEGISSITGGIVATETYLPLTADVREFDGSEAFALNGTHLRRSADNSTGDVVVFVAKADAGNIDIVSILATFNTLG